MHLSSWNLPAAGTTAYRPSSVISPVQVGFRGRKWPCLSSHFLWRQPTIKWVVWGRDKAWLPQCHTGSFLRTIPVSGFPVGSSHHWATLQPNHHPSAPIPPFPSQTLIPSLPNDLPTCQSPSQSQLLGLTRDTPFYGNFLKLCLNYFQKCQHRAMSTSLVCLLLDMKVHLTFEGRLNLYFEKILSGTVCLCRLTPGSPSIMEKFKTTRSSTVLHCHRRLSP